MVLKHYLQKQTLQFLDKWNNHVYDNIKSQNTIVITKNLKDLKFIEVDWDSNSISMKSFDLYVLKLFFLLFLKELKT